MLPGAVRGVLPGVLVALLLTACSTSPPEDPTGPTGAASPSATASSTPEPCAEAAFEPSERTDVRSGTRVVVYALPLDLEPGQRGRVPVTLRRLVDLRPGVRPPEGPSVDAGVLRRVAAALPGGSTGPLADTFATEIQVARASSRPRRLVVYAATRARPFDWTARVCGPPTTTDGSATEVRGTGLVLDRFATGRLDCARAAAPTSPRTGLTRQLVALCGA